MKRFLGVVTAIVIMCSTLPLHVDARRIAFTPENMEYAFDYALYQQVVTPETFDYAWYLEKYPDVAAAIPADDTAAIWNYFQTIGKPSGRIGRVTLDSLITEENFDYIRYANENPDLMALFGLDPAALLQHYRTSGVAEGRKAYTIYEDTNAEIQIYALADTITAGCTTDREKVKAVHDWMVKNIAYDYDNYVNNTIPGSSYDVSGPILHGKAVCQGYAETFGFFMDVLGIECKLISGQAKNNSGWGGHAWNKVKLDGSWYYIDVTWDDPVPDRGATVFYTYYLKTDPTFGGNHRLND